MLARLVDVDVFDPKIAPPIGVSVMVAGISRGMVMEPALGVSLGHKEAKQFVGGGWPASGRVRGGEAQPALRLTARPRLRTIHLFSL